MGKNKILTISIAAYNVENYIRKAIESLIDEEIIDLLEIFVVDDGGKDRTLEIAQEYADKYPQSIFCIHKENGGYGSTINESLKLASGKYFKQLDGDDWLRLDNLKDFIRLLNNIDADVVLSATDNYYEECGKYVSLYYDYVKEGLHNIEEVGLKTRFSIHTVTILTSILKRMNRALTEHCFYTDSEFISYPIPYIETIYIYHKSIYVYRIGGRDEQSSSLLGVRKHYKEMERIIDNVLEVYNGLNDGCQGKRNLLSFLIKARIIELYRFYCVLPFSINSIKKIMALSKRLKHEYPGFLNDICRESRTVRALVKGTPILLYPAAHFWIKRTWRKPFRRVLLNS